MSDEDTTQPARRVPDATTAMVTALVRLRGALQEARLPLELPGAAEQRAAQAEMVDQLEDYVIPRLMTLDAPLLAVVGGSTGAGKSTLVNSLVGSRVTTPGVLRPTTRSPVLVHHPDDAQWFGQDRLLPELERVTRSTDDPGALQLVASEAMTPGLATVGATSDTSSRWDLALAAAQPKEKLVILPGVNHVLKTVATDSPAANFATYSDSSLPIAPDVVDAIAGFVGKR